jgi:hypothetical protein
MRTSKELPFGLSVLGVAAVIVLFGISPAAAHSVGFLGGMDLATLSVDPDDGVDYSNRSGLAIGGVFDLTLDENVSIKFEPMFAQKGSDIEILGADGTIKLDYFALPALFKFAFGQGSTRPYLMAGPEIDFKLNAEVEDESGNELDIDDSVKGTDFGAGLGGGVDFAAGGGKTFFAEGRYTTGFTDINDTDSGEEIKTRAFQILGGITFPLD